MKNENTLLDKLSKIEFTSLKKVDTINKNFNLLKNEIQKINEYLKTKEQDELFDTKKKSSFNFKELEKQIKEFLDDQRKENLSVIDNNFNELEKSVLLPCESIKNDLNNINNIIIEVENTFHTQFKELNDKDETSQKDISDSQVNLVNLANTEFNKIYSIISDDHQKYEGKRIEYINTIQNMLMQFSTQFKFQQNEKHNFEEKIVVLLEELCKKMCELKKSSQNN